MLQMEHKSWCVPIAYDPTGTCAMEYSLFSTPLHGHLMLVSTIDAILAMGI